MRTQKRRRASITKTSVTRLKRRLPFQRIAIIVGALAAAVLGYFIISSLAGDDYPYKSDPSTEVDPWAFYKRECTSFATWRMRNTNGYGDFMNNMKGPSGQDIHLGHGYQWRDAAAAGGFGHDTTPAKGAIAWWPQN